MQRAFKTTNNKKLYFTLARFYLSMNKIIHFLKAPSKNLKIHRRYRLNTAINNPLTTIITPAATHTQSLHRDCTLCLKQRARQPPSATILNPPCRFCVGRCAKKSPLSSVQMQRYIDTYYTRTRVCSQGVYRISIKKAHAGGI